MQTNSEPAEAEPAKLGPSGALIAIMAVATGVLVANLYYSQPIIGIIAPQIKVDRNWGGTLVSVTQLGYGLGLFFLVSLSDLVENRRLVLLMVAGAIVGLLAAAVSMNAAIFLIASFTIGVCSTGAQVLVPFVAHLAPIAKRGQVVGTVMAGLLTGIMLARPAALAITGVVGWRAVFWIASGLLTVIGIALARIMPRHEPKSGLRYGQNLASMLELLRSSPILRRRAGYQALMFAGFNLFWTASPLMLVQRFGLTQYGIALFALAGAGGALAAPLAGRLADSGYTRRATGGAMAVLGLSFLATLWSANAGLLAILVVLAILIDGAVQMNQVVSQRIIFSLPSESRGRVNAIYMSLVFFGGAFGSAMSTALYHWGGWPAIAATGALIGLTLLTFFAFEKQ
jgi:predicted MFS family arabinose efflux permease